MKIVLLLALLLVLLIPQTTNALTEQNILSTVNRQRQTPLSINQQLTIAAQSKADTLATCQCFTHRPNGANWMKPFKDYQISYLSAGENLAVDYRSTKPLIKGWMNSSLHRTNIVNSRFTQTGIGIAHGYYQGHKTIYVVQLFIEPFPQ